MRKTEPWTRPTSRDDLAAWYSAALEAQSASGLSVPAYAERLGVSAWTLYQWRRRLAESPDDRAKLIEVAVAGPSDPASTSPLVVRVNDGRRAIEVPREFDPNELRRLLAALESC